MRIDGACHCGAISYEAEIEPDAVIICHCTDCQVNSATAFRYGVLVASKDFRLLSGEPKRYMKVADSGRPRELAFCGDCGTSLYGSEATDSPSVLSPRLGTARQRAALKPQRQIWHRSALPWLAEIDVLPAFDTQPNMAGGTGS
jgi:hypothetical protein